MTESTLSLSSVEQLRHNFARLHAQRLCEHLACPANEMWLAAYLDGVFEDYDSGWEKLAKHYEEETLKAYRLQPTPPFLVKKLEEHSESDPSR